MLNATSENGPPPVGDAPAEPVKTSGAAALATCAPAATVPVGTPGAVTLRACTMREERFAQLYLLHRNKARAWREAYNKPNATLHESAEQGYRVSNRPSVRKRVQQLFADVAAAVQVDAAELLEADLAIVRAARHADELTQFVWSCCRYCHGAGHRYQWVDAAEYCEAVAKVMDDNAARTEKHQRHVPLPADDGGYGFNRMREPHPACPTCGGLGEQRAVFADTRSLSPNVAPLFRGVKQTANGIEILMHDPDKAKERLMRCGGMFGDDAASVARGAAAGAAAGATVARRAAEIDEAMSAEQAARIYLELSQ